MVGKIYELYSPSKGLYYVGSTMLNIETRVNLHRSCKGVGGLRSKLVTEDDKFTYKVLETLKKTKKNEMLEKEGEYIKMYREKYGDSLVNKNVAGSCVNGKYPREVMQEYLRVWKDNNKDKYAQYNRTYYLKKKNKKIEENNLTSSI